MSAALQTSEGTCVDCGKASKALLLSACGKCWKKPGRAAYRASITGLIAYLKVAHAGHDIEWSGAKNGALPEHAAAMCLTCKREVRFVPGMAG